MLILENFHLKVIGSVSVSNPVDVSLVLFLKHKVYHLNV